MITPEKFSPLLNRRGLRGVAGPVVRGVLRYSGGPAPFVGVLDGLAATPAAAWSVSRALKAAWVGEKLFDLRRSSDNGTLSIYAGDDGEADLSGYAAWAGADTIFVSRVYDQSGNAKDWVQGTAGSQPKFTLTGPGGKPAIFDDNTRNAAMGMTAGAPVDGMWTAGGSAYVALQCGGSGSVSIKSSQIRVMGSEGPTAGYVRPGFYYGWSGAGFGIAYWRCTAADPVAQDTPFVWAVEYNAGSSANAPTAYLNGTSAPLSTIRAASGTAETDNGNLTIFSFGTDGMYIAETVYFAAILSSGDRDTLNDDLTARYTA